MARSRRVVIDFSTTFEDTGIVWGLRQVWLGTVDNAVPVQRDYVSASIPGFVVPGRGYYAQVTVWSTGLISFGPVTPAQIAHMATLDGNTDLTAFLAAFPGDYVADRFQSSPYGHVEIGTGMRDPTANPFNLDEDPASIYDSADCETFSYVRFSDPLYDVLPSFPGSAYSGGFGIDFTEEGFSFQSRAGAYGFGGVSKSDDDGRVYYSDFNIWAGTENADTRTAVTAETLNGFGGDDVLNGSGGADYLIGGKGDDILSGGGGVDRLEGGAGDDTLTDGDERGILLGGDGDDILITGGGEDVIDGGEGVDRLVLDFSGAAGSIVLWYNADAVDHLIAGTYKQIRNVELLDFTGGAARDTVTGYYGADVIRQGGGGGRLDGSGGNDMLFGGDGRDQLIGGWGDDYLDGGAAGGPLYIASNGGTYSLQDEPHIVLEGEADPNTNGLYYELNFEINDPASQWLELSWADPLNEQGDRVLRIDVAIYDFNGEYIASWSDESDRGNAIFQPEAAGKYLIVWNVYPDHSYAKIEDMWVGAQLHGVEGPQRDEMIGGTGDDIYIVDHADDLVVEAKNEGKHDEIRTGLSFYSLAALPHVEDLTGDPSAQALIGNKAANLIRGGGGADRLSGGGGNDTIVVTEAFASVEGGKGRDTLHIAAQASVTAKAGSITGIETITVAAGASLDLAKLGGGVGTIRALGTGTTIRGSQKDDTIFGSGDGEYWGLGGDDRITGGKGDDFIAGGSGADVLAGGAGKDLFFFRGVGDLANGKGQHDQILDFGKGDRISFADMDADPGSPGSQRFTYIGNGAFTGSGAAEVRWAWMGKGQAAVQIDIDHDKQADTWLLVTTDHALTAKDFVL